MSHCQASQIQRKLSFLAKIYPDQMNHVSVEELQGISHT